MTSNNSSMDQAFVWIWLPNESEPVVAGLIKKSGDKYAFTYGRKYREKANAIMLSPYELPLKEGTFYPIGMNNIHSCLRDAAPDAWGRRIINYQHPHINPTELEYLLYSGSNRIGALDFQSSSTNYIPRQFASATLSELLNATQAIMTGDPLPMELEQVLLRGTSIGGARPKCLIGEEDTPYIAKFPLSTDLYDIIKAEYIAMRLAEYVGINASKVHLKKVLKKSVLLVERFDRSQINQTRSRHILLSGLSLLGLNELEARYASYCDLADLIRRDFQNPQKDLLELYQRLVFNILIGNTDDHARNHSAFWDGLNLNLTPAYDLCPQFRSGREATQAMAIEGVEDNLSKLSNVLSVCERFMLSKDEAKGLIERQITIIKDKWLFLCDEAEMPQIERKKLYGKAILNPFCFQDWPFKD